MTKVIKTSFEKTAHKEQKAVSKRAGRSSHTHRAHDYLDPHFTISTLTWINTHFIKVDSDLAKLCIDYWTSYVLLLIRTKGPAEAIKRLKWVRLHVTRFLCGEPLTLNALNIGVNKSGIPKCLGPLRQLLFVVEDADGYARTRLLMTLLILSRSIKGGHGKPDLSPITNGYTGGSLEEYKPLIRRALKDLGFLGDGAPPLYETYHASTKVGTLGNIATLDSVPEAHAIKGEPELITWLQGIQPRNAKYGTDIRNCALVDKDA